MQLLKTNNIKLNIEYNGLPYSGWQSQKNEKTIQGEIEKAIFKFCGQQTVIQGAGRTDAGVHALGQCANFFIDKKFSEYQIVNGINFHLGSEKIRIVSISKNNLAVSKNKFWLPTEHQKYAENIC